MALEDLFFDLAGEPRLIQGSTDEDGVPEPHAVHFDEVVRVLGLSQSRLRALAHLRGLMTWLADSGAGATTWLRGELAATKRPEVEALDVVAVVNLGSMRHGDHWIAQSILASPLLLPPLRLDVTVVDPGDTERLKRERTRSTWRCRELTSGEAVPTGWLEVKL
ncbi:hypothetical protein [Actinomarinicola tropica]|uniref:Uncharacterized protein n=1 Tax=Actinomarinicola tropica TaxID=2789776 RepID=A0A5Q2RUB1_9ACTN|nr:hypothetical protein [Actinomarinicola tropica]QGG96795.1 hypothetical protein GH723_17775 [Actinomarinicola tropica]